MRRACFLIGLLLTASVAMSFSWGASASSPEVRRVAPSSGPASSAVVIEGSGLGVAVVTPTGSNTQHNGQSMAVGDNWIGSVVQAIEDGPDWNSTAVFITYDDCGCFYDHVAPPLAKWGIRLPMVIVSPPAQPGYTDSHDANLLSPLAFLEHNFGLEPLNGADASAYDYADSFDFSGPPVKAVRMTHTVISHRERWYLRAHPFDETDPT